MKTINLEITWISLENNGDNEFINEFISCDDNIFQNSTFESITEKWGTMTVDCFA